MIKKICFIVLSIYCLLSSCFGDQNKKDAITRALEVGTKTIQNFSALKQFNLLLVAFHPLKDNPSMQMIAYHYCAQLNKDIMQCILFDGDRKNAKLNGIEYIIPSRIFAQLPNDEKPFWHPHNYEILSGQLVAPRIPAAIENELMKKKINSYGKTWHVWMTDSDALPLGNAKLAWSFNHDGELNKNLIEKRDKDLGINTSKIREERKFLQAYVKPQDGEDVLKDKFNKDLNK